MTELDRQQARERNQRLREEGTTARQRIMSIMKRLTAGKLTTEGRHYHLDHNVLEFVRRRELHNDMEQCEKRRI